MEFQLQTSVKIDAQRSLFRFTDWIPRCFGVKLLERPLFKRINENPPPNVDVSIWEIRDKEIVAELGSAVLLECLGRSHDADFGGAYDYIESYAASAQKPVVKACTEVLDRACNCVKLILDTAASLRAESTPA